MKQVQIIIKCPDSHVSNVVELANSTFVDYLKFISVQHLEMEDK